MTFPIWRPSEDPVPLFPVGGDVPQLGGHHHVLLRPQPQLCQQRGSNFSFSLKIARELNLIIHFEKQKCLAKDLHKVEVIWAKAFAGNIKHMC